MSQTQTGTNPDILQGEETQQMRTLVTPKSLKPSRNLLLLGKTAAHVPRGQIAPGTLGEHFLLPPMPQARTSQRLAGVRKVIIMRSVLATSRPIRAVKASGTVPPGTVITESTSGAPSSQTASSTPGASLDQSSSQSSSIPSSSLMATGTNTAPTTDTMMSSTGDVDTAALVHAAAPAPKARMRKLTRK